MTSQWISLGEEMFQATAALKGRLPTVEEWKKLFKGTVSFKVSGKSFLPALKVVGNEK
jgi:hypothetical protein